MMFSAFFYGAHNMSMMSTLGEMVEAFGIKICASGTSVAMVAIGFVCCTCLVFVSGVFLHKAIYTHKRPGGVAYNMMPENQNHSYVYKDEQPTIQTQ